MEKLHFAKGRMILPLTGSSYELGKMKEAIDLIEDTQLAEIACAEACYFTADAKGCVEHVKKYLASDDVMLRLSADMLYVFANLTLGNAGKAQAARIMAEWPDGFAWRGGWCRTKPAECLSWYTVGPPYTFRCLRMENILPRPPTRAPPARL